MITDHLGTRSTQGLCKYIERQDKLEPPKMMKICREMGRPKTHLRSGMWIIGWVCREMPWLKQTSGHQEEHFLHLQLVSWCFTGALTGNPISRWQQHNWQENWYVQTRCFRESKKTEPFFFGRISTSNPFCCGISMALSPSSFQQQCSVSLMHDLRRRHSYGFMERIGRWIAYGIMYENVWGQCMGLKRNCKGLQVDENGMILGTHSTITEVSTIFVGIINKPRWNYHLPHWGKPGFGYYHWGSIEIIIESNRATAPIPNVNFWHNLLIETTL